MQTTCPIEDLGRTAQFDAALSRVNAERGANYGTPGQNFTRMATAWDVIDECKDPVVRHALYMIWVNVVRLVETPDYADGPIDIAGYARTIAMALDELKK